jgi:hypothetical protein
LPRACRCSKRAWPTPHPRARAAFPRAGVRRARDAVWPQAPLSISGEFPPGKLQELIALEGGDVVFFPAQCPEIFSYTLSAALDSGLPIVATGIGALPERLAQSPLARIVAWDAGAAQLNDALVAAAAVRSPAATPRPRVSFEDYVGRYREGWAAPRADRAASPPALEARWLREPAAPPERRPLAFFYEDGVVCGRGSSLEGLRKYAFGPGLPARGHGRARARADRGARGRARETAGAAAARPRRWFGGRAKKR